MPNRVQRKRTKGWTVPAGAVYVGRGRGAYGRWGNPTKVVYRKDTGGWHTEHDNGAGVGVWPTADGARQFAVQAYRAHLTAHPELVEAARRELAGRDLMCWCPIPEPGKPDHCHGAVLLELVAATSMTGDPR